MVDGDEVAEIAAKRSSSSMVVSKSICCARAMGLCADSWFNWRGGDVAGQLRAHGGHADRRQILRHGAGQMTVDGLHQCQYALRMFGRGTVQAVNQPVQRVEGGQHGHEGGIEGM
jgi:hypothetical protein